MSGIPFIVSYQGRPAGLFTGGVRGAGQGVGAIVSLHDKAQRTRRHISALGGRKIGSLAVSKAINTRISFERSIRKRWGRNIPIKKILRDAAKNAARQFSLGYKSESGRG